MKLTDGQGTILNLDIDSYQFESQVHGIYSPLLIDRDCNWLMIKGHVVLPVAKKSWEFMDPCLNTAELENLASWFNKISTTPVTTAISFVEPNLRLAFYTRPIPMIKVTLSHECASPWKKRTFPGFDELSFPTDCNDLARIAGEMYDLASKFPSRNQPEIP